MVTNRTPYAEGPLAGLRVLEVGDEPVQLCGKLLADLGADVLKIEPPGGGAARHTPPFWEDAAQVNRSLHFWHYNTSKRSVTLNLDHPEGAALFHNLAASADVLLEGEPLGTMSKRGLGYPEVSARNPGTVYCSVTPYGQSGPWSAYKSCDLTLMAAGGQMAMCGYDSDEDDPDRQPIAPGGGNAWHTGAHYAAIAILVALEARDATGGGDYIDVSVQEALAVCTEGAFAEYLMTGENRLRRTGRHASALPTPPVQFRCRDGRYVNTVLPSVDMEAFLRLATWLEEEGVVGDLLDERYRDPEFLRQRMGQVLEAVGRLCAKLTSNEVFHRAQARHFPWSVIRTPSDTVHDPHQNARGFFVSVGHAEHSRAFTYPGAPYRFSATPWQIYHRAPLLGEHTVAVLCDELGLSHDEVRSLAQTGIV